MPKAKLLNRFLYRCGLSRGNEMSSRICIFGHRTRSRFQDTRGCWTVRSQNIVVHNLDRSFNTQQITIGNIYCTYSGGGSLCANLSIISVTPRLHHKSLTLGSSSVQVRFEQHNRCLTADSNGGRSMDLTLSRCDIGSPRQWFHFVRLI